jgi:hypothetical protein
VSPICRSTVLCELERVAERQGETRSRTDGEPFVRDEVFVAHSLEIGVGEPDLAIEGVEAHGLSEPSVTRRQPTHDDRGGTGLKLDDRRKVLELRMRLEARDRSRPAEEASVQSPRLPIHDALENDAARIEG